MISLLDACKMALAWFDKMTNDESVWEEQPSADMATIMAEALESYRRVQGTPPGPQHGREPDKVKPLAQYLDKYLEAAWKGAIDCAVGVNGQELLKQALDAYESTENVKIRIERN